MDAAAFDRLMTAPGLAARTARAALRLAEPAYSLAARLNGRRRHHRAQSLPVPVVSVGNLTCGGTGKTPVVAWLANRLTREGWSPGLLSRGYGAVDDRGNDERRVLDALCPGVPHEQDRDRIAAGRRLIADGCDLLILDDGFQYRQLHRTVDLVVVDALNPWGYGHCLPRGLLREPVAALSRATHVLINRVDSVDAATVAAIRAEITRHTAAPVLTADVRPTRLIDADGRTAPLSELDADALPFCGLGNPAGFAATLASLGVTGRIESFPDHHHFGPADLARLADLASRRGCDQLVCTQKDLVKLTGGRLAGRDVWAIEIALQIETGASSLLQAIDSCGRTPLRQAA